GRHQSVQIGPFELADVELDTPDVPHGDLSRAGRANIGNRLLARFPAIALDYQRRVLTLEPDKASVSSRQ
ncbi:MAG TPA: hypothetical protein VKE41_21345, partial [Roseiflexaceae bacterium]|nr:hypothetical protein [Roseiflexaceae bacterium]